MRTRTSFLCRLAVTPLATVAILATAPVAANAPDAVQLAQAGAATAKSAKTVLPYQGQRASRLMGMNVDNARGENIGEISDLVVDLNTGALRYAILSFDPGLLSAERLFAVPLNQLRMQPGQRHAVYDVDAQQLERASFNRSDWTERFFTDESRVRRLDQAWNFKEPTERASAFRVSDLIGKDIDDRNGREIGEIEDLVIDLSRQRVHYAVAEFDLDQVASGQYHALPLSSLQFVRDRDRDNMGLAMDTARLQAVPSFSRAQWANLNERKWVGDVDRRFGQMSGTAGGAAVGTADATDRFSRLDSNRDGWIGREEMRTDTAVAEMWSTLDRDRDGRISREEFSRVWGDTNPR